MASISDAVGRVRSAALRVRLPWVKSRAPKLVVAILLYVLLVDVAFVFLYPLIYMGVTSVKTLNDWLDPTVHWVPKSVTFEHFGRAFTALNYAVAFGNSALIAIVSAVFQLVSCSLAGYGFARAKFPGKSFLFLLVIFTFIVPPQTVIIPLYITYLKLELLDTPLPFIIPSLFGQGLRGGIFIFIFRQFFLGLPWELEDAARIDGASGFGIFRRIILPLSKPAILVVFLFSLVWHWNDFFEPMMYLNTRSRFTLPLFLTYLEEQVHTLFVGFEFYIEPLIMAGCLLVIAPPLLLYLFAQRYFVESIERTGLIG